MPWQKVFHVEGLSPLAWRGGAFPGVDGKLLPLCMVAGQNGFVLQKHPSLSYMFVIYMSDVTCGILMGKKKNSSFVLKIVLLLG